MSQALNSSADLRLRFASMASASGSGAWIASHDWSGSELGPVESWPSSLLALVETVLVSPRAAAVVCGSKRILLCNDEAARLFEIDVAASAEVDASIVLSRVWRAGEMALDRAFSGASSTLAHQTLGADRERRFGAQFIPWPAGPGQAGWVQISLLEETTPASGAASAGPPPRADDFPALLWSAGEGGRWTWAGAQWRNYTGQGGDESLGMGWLQAVHLEDRDDVLALAAGLARDARRCCDHRVFSRADKGYRWFRSRVGAALGSVEGSAETVGVSVEIDNLFAPRDKQASAHDEYRRRMRNTLGILRSVARRTAETSDTLDDFAMHFEGRLDALARVEALISGAPGGAVDLQSLIVEELLTFGGREDDRLAISGPPLRLRYDAAETLSLAVHELAANAMKFGALSPQGGRLDVSWRILPAPASAVALTWKESNPSGSVPPPKRGGFGVELLERGLAYRLKARVSLRFEPHGVICEMELPLARLTEEATPSA